MNNNYYYTDILKIIDEVESLDLCDPSDIAKGEELVDAVYALFLKNNFRLKHYKSSFTELKSKIGEYEARAQIIKQALKIISDRIRKCNEYYKN